LSHPRRGARSSPDKDKASNKETSPPRQSVYLFESIYECLFGSVAYLLISPEAECEVWGADARGASGPARRAIRDPLHEAWARNVGVWARCWTGRRRANAPVRGSVPNATPQLNRTDAQPLRQAAVFMGGRQGSDLTKVPRETLAQRFIPAGPISFQHLASATAERLRAVTPA
jgi:hypothetical protein